MRKFIATVFVFIAIGFTGFAATGTAAAPVRPTSPAVVKPIDSAVKAREYRYCNQYPSFCRLEKKLERLTSRDWTQSEVRVLVAFLRARERAIARYADNPPTGCPAGGYDCYRGGIRWKNPCAIPEYICDRESNPYDDDEPGFIDVGNPGSSAAGKYQFVDRTWSYAARGAGFPEWADSSAGYAPEHVQDAAARWLWDGGNGAGHWGCC